MLTDTLIKQQPILATMTPEQIEAVVTLSQNDENTVIAQKTRELYDRLDMSIKEATGIEKERSEKSSEYAKRAIEKLKGGNGSELQTQLDQLKTQNADLQKQIKDGNTDSALKKQVEVLEGKIKDKESEVKQWQTKHKADTENLNTLYTKAQESMLGLQIDHAFSQAMAEFKFKDDKTIPKEVRESFIKNAKATILAEAQAEFVDDGKGGKTLVFKNKEGEIMRNAENQLQPYNAADLLRKHLTPVLDNGRQAQGTGGQPPAAGKAPTNFMLSATTRVEADTQINEYLTSIGVDKLSDEWQTKFSEIRKENNVSELPMQ